MPKYRKAESGPGRSVIYTDSDGKQWKFEGGSRPWRNQNPGNLVPGKVSDSEFQKLWKAIEKMEGWKEGTITPYSMKGQIRAVTKDKKGTIQSYLIEGYGWVSKVEAIELTMKGKVDAVVATSPRGNGFLRARPNSDVLDNLEAKAQG